MWLKQQVGQLQLQSDKVPVGAAADISKFADISRFGHLHLQQTSTSRPAGICAAVRLYSYGTPPSNDLYQTYSRSWNIMSTSTLNVVRYTALLSGVFYGIAHRRTLQKEHDAEKRHHEEHEREKLIKEAKEAWKRKKEQQSSKSDVITDPEDPRFDLEKLLAKWEKEHQ